MPVAGHDPPTHLIARRGHVRGDRDDHGRTVDDRVSLSPVLPTLVYDDDDGSDSENFVGEHKLDLGRSLGEPFILSWGARQEIFMGERRRGLGGQNRSGGRKYKQ